MAGATLSTVDNILKEVIEPGLQEQMNNEVLTLRRIEKSSEGVTQEVGGKYVRFALKVKRNHGIGARNENEALPAAGANGYIDAQIKLTHQYGSIQLTGQTFELAEKNFQAFASALQQEIDGLKQTLAKDMNRQTYGTSKGVMATANATGTTTTLLMTNAQAIYLEVGMIVDHYGSNNVIKTSAVEITNVTKNSSPGVTTVTFTPAAGAATVSGDYLTRDDNKDKEIIGFQELVGASNTLHNVNPATYPIWKSVIDSPGSARSISETLMTSMIDDIRTNGGRTTVIFTSLGVRRAYANLLQQQRRYTNTTKFEGGFSGIAFTTDSGDIPVVSDFDCPYNTMFYLNEKEIKLYRAGDWSWMNRDGSNWQRLISGGNTYDAYYATMYKYCNMGTHRRNTHGLQTNITEA